MDTGQGPGSPPRGQMCEGHRCNIQKLCVLHLCPSQRLFPERTSMLEIELNRKAW